MREKIDLVAIIMTHGHFDHVLAALEIKLNFGVPVYINRKDEFLLAEAGKSAAYWTGVKGGQTPKADHDLKAGELKIGKVRFEVIETPGHTPGSVCLYAKEERILFSGDTLFKDGVGRTDFSYSDGQEMKMSLKKLSQLPGETVVYSGHGEETLIGRELGDMI